VRSGPAQVAAFGGCCELNQFRIGKKTPATFGGGMNLLLTERPLEKAGERSFFGRWCISLNCLGLFA